LRWSATERTYEYFIASSIVEAKNKKKEDKEG